MATPHQTFTIHNRPAFILPPEGGKERAVDKPWIWYAPRFVERYPGPEEDWMIEQFHENGIALAGVDVGESYGSPWGRAVFEAFYQAMIKRGYSKRPVLLARSRGGLMLYNWATEHPQNVAAIAGIYPVCNLASYPGLDVAAPAYGMTVSQLETAFSEHNPIDRVATLARAGVPVLHRHGDHDVVVPLEENTAKLAERYREHGGLITVEVIPGEGHSGGDVWFKSVQLTEFVIEHAVGR